MAVKRVILQHFSMKYDYLTKERPNIYQPSRAEFHMGSGDEDIEVGEDASIQSSSIEFESNGSDTTLDATNDDDAVCHRSIIRSLDTNSSSALDSIIEMKEKLPDTYNISYKNAASAQSNPLLSGRDSTFNDGYNDGYYKPTYTNIRPEENWRNRSNNSTTIDRFAKNQRNYRNFKNANTNNSSSNNNNNHMNYGATRYRQQRKGYNSYSNDSNNDHVNWRNECMTNSSSRNCGMIAERLLERRESDTSDIGIGLSPPSESLLIQRRLRSGSRSSDISLHGLQSPTAANG